MIYNIKSNEFSIKKKDPYSPILSFADEINRAPVQSALLEKAMQEKQVTIGDTTFKLDRPFLVLATQNPIEQRRNQSIPEGKSIVLC
jgi:MoxR-like ATPase